MHLTASIGFPQLPAADNVRTRPTAHLMMPTTTLHFAQSLFMLIQLELLSISDKLKQSVILLLGQSGFDSVGSEVGGRGGLDRLFCEVAALHIS